MDKRNRPALAYLLAGIATAGRALLAVPEGTNLTELSLTALVLLACLLLGSRGTVPLLCTAVELVLECLLCAAGLSPAVAPVLRVADLWLLLVVAGLLLRTAGQPAKAMPVAAAVPLAVYTAAQFLPLPPVAGSTAFVVFSVLLLWYTVLMMRAYNATKIKKEKPNQ